MTAIPSTEKFWGVDSFESWAFVLNSDGSPKAVDTSAYEGYEIDGTRDFNLNPAAGTTVANVGNGRLRDTIYRAPRDPSTAELLIGYNSPAVKAALSGVKTYTVGELLGIARLTNVQGSEPDIAMIVSQRGHNGNGLTRYRTIAIPKARVIPRDAALNDNASQESYQVTMSNSQNQIWGLPFSVATHGATEAAYEEFLSENPIHICAWLADGAETEFLLPTDKQAVSTAKLAIYNFTSGAVVTAGITKAVTGVTFDYPPTDGDIIVAVYEYAASS